MKSPSVLNPLGIVAIFSGTTEVVGMMMLKIAAAENQRLLVIFLMYFPVILIGLFFYTLYNRHHVFYAPSDFLNQDRFSELIQKSVDSERRDKIQGEVEQASTEIPIGGNEDHHGDIVEKLRKAYIKAEGLAISRIEAELGCRVEREYRIKSGKTRFALDGIIMEGENYIAIEVKYILSLTFSNDSIKNSLDVLDGIFSQMKEREKKKFRLILAVVIGFNVTPEQNDLIVSRMHGLKSGYSLPIEMRFYQLSDLHAKKSTTVFADGGFPVSDRVTSEN
jgi:hypothetical protein